MAYLKAVIGVNMWGYNCCDDDRAKIATFNHWERVKDKLRGGRMNKPEKKVFGMKIKVDPLLKEGEWYLKKCTLPDLEELNTILWEANDDWNNTHGDMELGLIRHLASAIAKRLGVKCEQE